MTNEAGDLVAIVSRIIDTRRSQSRISPSWVANEAMIELDGGHIAPPLVYLGCHLELRQIARSVLRTRFDDRAESDDGEPRQHELFPDLQWRYPTARSARSAEPEYVLLDDMSDEDAAYNVARLRREGRAKLAHADALEAWKRRRRRVA
ncbi:MULTISPECIES: hypothetical protein [Bradyrhizobium]|uniref:Uncharacterized protein n=1 Tax=Bradyrhizobium barranii subsp. barranii TaxID=2823807 RepID=A0A9X9XW85_9BRAD|nr:MULTISPECIES: hypothetical protein [Bradyrhizobium]UEM11929.1 hypothetical protein J4G43_047065 [Bradyrhizobium barranii subsp. barranii]